MELDDGWWRKDQGPLLGFYVEGDNPVVLHRKNGSYHLLDPLLSKKEKVNEKSAKKISSLAYEFYPTLPEERNRQNPLSVLHKKQSERDPAMVQHWDCRLYSALYIPFANALIFNKVIPYSQDSLLNQVGFGLFVIAISYALFSLLFSFITLRFQMMMNIRVQTAMWSRLLNLPIPFFRRYTTGDLIKRVFTISTIQTTLSSSVFSSLFSAIFSLLYLAIMFYFSLILAIFSVLLFTFSILANFLLIHFMVKVESKVLEQQGSMNSFILQVMGGIEKIRLTGAENIILTKWGKSYAKLKENNLQSNQLANGIETLNSFVPTLGLFGNFVLGFYLISENRLTLGDFIAYSAAFGSFSMALSNAFSTMSCTFSSIIPQWKRSKVIFDEPEESRLNKVPPGKLNGSLEVDNVSFRYSEEGPLVLKGVSIKADPGEYVAIVGPSGSGKSTLVSLLLQFNFPTSGSILYNGKDLTELDITKVRRQLGVVLQESDILSGTIEDNLISAGTMQKERVDEAMHLSGFEKVLQEMPMGLKTYLVDNGKNLSGGQKQQLLIARALLSNPKILIFDEATNALDNRSQEVITSNLNRLKITRFITHRLSTVLNADRIYVMERGVIVEEGTYDELSQRGGLFAKMLEKQRL